MAAHNGPEAKRRRADIAQARKLLKQAAKNYRRQARDARARLAAVERGRDRRLRSARAAVKHAEERHARVVAQAEGALDRARDPAPLATYRGQVVLYEDRIVAPEGAAELSRQVKAKAQSSGRLTKNSDTRELYLLLETPYFDSLIVCNPNHGAQVRALASAINTAAKQASAAAGRRAALIEAAEEEARRVRQDRSEIKAAERDLAAAEDDRDDVKRAYPTLTAAEHDTAAFEAAKTRLLELDADAKIPDLESRPRRSFFFWARVLEWWKQRSKKMKAGLIAASVLLFLIVLGAILGGGTSEPPSRLAENAVTPTITPPTESEAAPTTAAKKPKSKKPRPNFLVTDVLDGNTIRLANGKDVRLLQIDAPELGNECYGVRSANTLTNLLLDRRVRLAYDPKLGRVDTNGRLLAYVFKGRELVNRTLLLRGAAGPWFFRGVRGRYASKLLQAAENAKAAGRGLWKVCPRTELDPTSSLVAVAPPPPPPPATSEPTVSSAPASNCDPSYPDVCIPPYPPDLDCADVPYTDFRVVGSDPHGFDGEGDGIGCES